MNDYQYILRYDNNGIVTNYLRQRWKGQEWVNEYREIYTNNIKGNRTFSLWEVWRDGGWRNFMRRNFGYDNKQNMTSYFIEQWKNGIWNSYKEYIYEYDIQGNMTYYLIELWNGIKLDSTISVRHTYEYNNNGNETLYLREDLEGDVWKNIHRSTSTYNSNGKRILYFSEKWENETLVNDKRKTYQFDDNGNMNLFLIERWDNTKWILQDESLEFVDSFGNWFNFTGGKIKLFYSTVTDIEQGNINISNFSLSQNYPNPFNPKTIIKYSIPFAKKQKIASVQLKVFDILGKEVATLVDKDQPSGNYKIEFNASSLTSGIYFYRLQSDSFSETKKLILLR